MTGSAFDLTSERATPAVMQGVVRVLDQEGATGTARTLSANEMAGLEENARRVAKKYWELKGTSRSGQSLQNQLNRPRWHYFDQVPYAKQVLDEVVTDSGMSFGCYP